MSLHRDPGTNGSLRDHFGVGAMREQAKIKFSIVVPIFNEEGSAKRLYIRLTQVMRAMGEPYEIVFVDDGSTDRSPAILRNLHEADSCVRIVSMDGDLQHDPAEIPSFIQKLD